MTYDQRQARGTILCQRLGDHVAAVAPTGIGHWDRCWEVVDAPSVEFMTALSAWEIEPSDVTMQRVSDAYDTVMAAWHVAVVEYTTEGAA